MTYDSRGIPSLNSSRLMAPSSLTSSSRNTLRKSRMSSVLLSTFAMKEQIERWKSECYCELMMAFAILILFLPSATDVVAVLSKSL